MAPFSVFNQEVGFRLANALGAGKLQFICRPGLRSQKLTRTFLQHAAEA